MGDEKYKFMHLLLITGALKGKTWFKLFELLDGTWTSTIDLLFYTKMLIELQTTVTSLDSAEERKNKLNGYLDKDFPSDTTRYDLMKKNTIEGIRSVEQGLLNELHSERYERSYKLYREVNAADYSGQLSGNYSVLKNKIKRLLTNNLFKVCLDDNGQSGTRGKNLGHDQSGKRRQPSWESWVENRMRQTRDQIRDTISEEKKLIQDNSNEIHNELLEAKKNELTCHSKWEKIHNPLKYIVSRCLKPHKAKTMDLRAVPNPNFIGNLKHCNRIKETWGPIYPIASRKTQKVTILDSNTHLKDHFDLPFSAQNTRAGRKYTGKFNVTGSLFEHATDIWETFLKALEENTEQLIGICDVKDDNGYERKNYVYFIYDYDKGGFIKTGDVYDSADQKWKPAYAIMFVTNEKHELITAYPLYM